MKLKIKNLKLKNKTLVATVLFILLTSFSVLLATPIVSAQVQAGSPKPSGSVGTEDNTKLFTLQNPIKVDSLGGLIQAFVEVFSYLVIIFAVLAIIYVGLRYILARGNPEEMKKMNAWLMYIVIGVAIVIGARILVGVVINTLGASGVVDRNIIQSANNALKGK